jgi:DNA-binding IclR family transcriptional regulator
MKPLGRSPLNRSLNRGIAILRAFRPGTDLLGNGELAERTGLPRASISRLTQTLIAAGYLEYDMPRQAYRLAPAVLTLGHAMRLGSPVVRTATPLMMSLARRMRINVGLATRDGDEMVYLESTRYNEPGMGRTVVAGQRIPIELTALGRAWLAAAPIAERAALMAQWRIKRRKTWPSLKSELAESILDVERKGYCVASWQPQVVALAAPLTFDATRIYAVNVSVTTSVPRHEIVERLEKPVLKLAKQISEAFTG